MSEPAFTSLQKIYEMASTTDTDKGTVHSYLDVYAALFGPRRYAVRNVLEIGVQTAGSIILWERFFPNAEILGMDITLERVRYSVDADRTRLVAKDAYTEEAVAEISDRRYDVIIDDGPHTLESMLFAAAKLPPLLAEGGIFVIEDVQKPEWIPQIVAALPEHLRSRAETVDRREIKRRYDDLMVVLRT